MATPLSFRELAARLMMPALDVERYHSEEKYRRELHTLVRDLGVGGVIVFNGTILATRDAVDELQLLAEQPLMVACDLEPGLRGRLTDAQSFPHAMAIGRTTTALCADVAECIGREARAAGITINFAPVCDINNNPKNPIINVRAFGENVEHVSTFAEAFIQGSHRAGVRAVIKHFPGHGNTSQDSHLTLPVINATLEQLEEFELAPFRRTIKFGADGVMAAHLLAIARDANLPASLSKNWIEKSLRTECGFSGVVFTDALMMHAISDRFTPQESAVLAVDAGCDVLVMPVDCHRAVDGLAEHAKMHENFFETVNRSAQRVEFFSGQHLLPPPSKNSQSPSAAIAKIIANEAISIHGLNVFPKAEKNSGIVILGGEKDYADMFFLTELIKQKSSQFKWNLNIDLNGANLLKYKVDIIFCFMFSGVISFQGDLGNFRSYQQVIDKYKSRANEIIGISLGNPYIWSELTEFRFRVNSYSNSRVSLRAVVELLATGTTID